MDEDEFNLSIRRFLKKVGITSQREIEKAVRSALDNGSISDQDTVKVSVTLNIALQDTRIEIDGEIKLQ